jgi:hypothetical protein
LFEEIDIKEKDKISYKSFRVYFNIPRGRENMVNYEKLGDEDKRSYDIIDDVVFLC